MASGRVIYKMRKNLFQLIGILYQNLARLRTILRPYNTGGFQLIHNSPCFSIPHTKPPLKIRC